MSDEDPTPLLTRVLEMQKLIRGRPHTPHDRELLAAVQLLLESLEELLADEGE